MSAARAVTGRRGPANARLAVECIKAGGVRHVIFKKYAAIDRVQAEIDAAALRKLGIHAEVVSVAASGATGRERAA